MSAALKISLLHANRPVGEFTLDQPIEVGRQRTGEPGPVNLQNRRLIITHDNDGSFFSRRHLTLEPLATGMVRVINHSRFPLEFNQPGSPLTAGEKAELAPPFRLLCQQLQIQVGCDESAFRDGMNSLDQLTRAPGSHPSDAARGLQAFPLLSAAQRQELVNWLQNFTNLLQSGLASTNLYDHAAQSVVQLGLSTGCVLLLQGKEWTVRACQGAAATTPAWQPNHLVLERLPKEKRTFFRLQGGPAPGKANGLRGPDAIIAAPLLDRDGKVLGALYGEGARGISNAIGPVTADLEAALVELLACSIASGLERDRMVRAQVQFEQFFGDQLARQLQQEPNLLAGRDAEVTVLFCDVRRFSTFCQSLKPAQVTEWMSDVLSELSACVLKEDGVLVDYIGDEIMAMWGAPRSQPDHALRGVRAGLAMLEEALPRLNQRWQQMLGVPIEIGVGVNTGMAQVGNRGSRYKFKYGPLGDSVNLASRVRGVTKYLGCPLLVTRSTREKLSEQFIARRVCLARVVNMPEPVDLYQLEMLGTIDRREFFRDSEEALSRLEAKAFVEAVRAAAPLLRDNPGDKPLLLVLSRATHHMLYPDAPFDEVWEPGGK